MLGGRRAPEAGEGAVRHVERRPRRSHRSQCVSSFDSKATAPAVHRPGLRLGSDGCQRGYGPAGAGPPRRPSRADERVGPVGQQVYVTTMPAESDVPRACQTPDRLRVAAATAISDRHAEVYRTKSRGGGDCVSSNRAAMEWGGFDCGGR